MQPEYQYNWCSIQLVAMGSLTGIETAWFPPPNFPFSTEVPYMVVTLYIECSLVGPMISNINDICALATQARNIQVYQ